MTSIDADQLADAIEGALGADDDETVAAWVTDIRALGAENERLRLAIEDALLWLTTGGRPMSFVADIMPELAERLREDRPLGDHPPAEDRSRPSGGSRCCGVPVYRGDDGRHYCSACDTQVNPRTGHKLSGN